LIKLFFLKEKFGYDYLKDNSANIVVVTVYIPSDDEWIAGQIRESTKRRR
jgi:hypothetical protein